MRFRVVLICLLAAVPIHATAQTETIQEYLRAFHDNPAHTMQRLPSLVNKNNEAIPQGFIDEAAVAATLPYRLELRERIRNRSAMQKNAMAALQEGERDLVEKLVDPGTIPERNLQNMQSQGLMGMAAPFVPWADSYWPMYRGLIAARYADPAFPNAKDFLINYNYSQNIPASGIAATGSMSQIDSLSPAEKYDLVMGDLDFTLTRYSWNQGMRRHEETGTVAFWMGICHGWAGAAHMAAPFVSRPVVVQAQNGIPVTFFPQDIKALESMLWANGSPTSRFIGSRCNLSSPPKDNFGRIVEPRCFDPNPAIWHLAIVNQLGRNKRSFVMDATYDAQVWNFPLVSAHYRYFNPQTFEESDSLRMTATPLEAFKLDKFRRHRTPDTKYVVGIYMDTTYTVEIEPSATKVFEAPSKTVRYIYDLELDAAYNVIGGEWYSNAHPDFLWTFEANAQAMASEDSLMLIDPWSNRSPVPLHWTAYARRASTRGEPLFAFLQKVISSSGASTRGESAPGGNSQ